MSDAISALPAAPMNTSKGLTEQENVAADQKEDGDFAALVESMLPPPPAAIPGTALPPTDLPLPADGTTAPTDGTAVPALTATVATVQMPLPAAGEALPAVPAEAATQWLSTLRAATHKSAGPAGSAAAKLEETETAVPLPEHRDTEAFGEGADDLAVSAPKTPGTPNPVAPGSVAGLADPVPGGAEAAPAGTGASGIGAHAERAVAAEAPKLVLDSKLPVSSPVFGDRFAEQVTVLVEHGIKHARLSLNPAELGPIEVRISFHQDEASVQFASHHGAVRDAMTDALPRLREMLDGAGVKLGESGVFAQLPQREQLGGGTSGASRAPVADAWEQPAEPAVHHERLSRHLVDAYA